MWKSVHKYMKVVFYSFQCNIGLINNINSQACTQYWTQSPYYYLLYELYKVRQYGCLTIYKQHFSVSTDCDRGDPLFGDLDKTKMTSNERRFQHFFDYNVSVSIMLIFSHKVDVPGTGLLVLIIHLNLYDMWCGVAPRTNTKWHLFKRYWTMYSKTF